MTLTLTFKQALLIVAVIIGIPLLALAWWLLSPLFQNTTIEEEFPFSARADMPAGMTQTEAENIMSGVAKITMESVEEMPSDMLQSELVSSGLFRDADSFHKGSGAAAIYRLPNGEGILRFDGLNVTNGPDLHVLLTTHPDPTSKQELQEAGYIGLGKLKGNRGNQNYDIPADTYLDSIGSVIIYCMPFHVIFSVAPLQKG